MTKPARKWIRLGECVLIMIAFQIAMSGSARSQTPPVASAESIAGDLTQLSIEDLMNLEVTSGAKKEQTVQRTAAAILVITSEEIRRKRGSGWAYRDQIEQQTPGAGAQRRRPSRSGGQLT